MNEKLTEDLNQVLEELKNPNLRVMFEGVGLKTKIKLVIPMLRLWFSIQDTKRQAKWAIKKLKKVENWNNYWEETLQFVYNED